MATPPPPPPSAPPPPPPPPPPVPPAAPAGKSNRTLFIVLGVLGGIILLIGGCVTTCTYFAAKKAKEYAVSAQKNPQFAALSLAAELNPEVQVISKDEASGKITLKNKKTGEVVSLDLNGYSASTLGPALEQFAKGMKNTAVASSSESTTTEPADTSTEHDTITPAQAAALAANTKRLPSYLPTYSGAKTVDATTNVFSGVAVSSYTFDTSDAPETVADFYEKKFTASGFTIISRANSANGSGAISELIAQHADAPAATVNLTAGIENGRTRVTVVSTGAK